MGFIRGKPAGKILHLAWRLEEASGEGMSRGVLTKYELIRRKLRLFPVVEPVYAGHPEVPDGGGRPGLKGRSGPLEGSTFMGPCLTAATMFSPRRCGAEPVREAALCL